MDPKPRRILTPEGIHTGAAPDIRTVRARYAALVEARLYDRKASALQRQGRLATYAPYEGQEAAQVGAVAPLETRDWLVASYRDAAAMRFHGYPWKELLLARMGDERGGHPPEGVKALPPSITVGGHMIHAVGLAWAERLMGSGAVALTMFGDGATSEGDFHEAMNFAGVYRTPTVFLCQNNGWAISMPRSRQTASETIAQKAVAYGFPGVVVDGNDVLAVEEVVAEAVARARAGKGPTLIEALTYRMRGHTTADDHGRYRPESDLAGWIGKDPIERVRLWLEQQGTWDEQWQAEIEAASSERIEEAVAEAEAVEPFTAAEIFDAMHAEPTPSTRALQRAWVRRALPMSVMTLAQALNSALDLALEDPRVLVMGEDVGATGGVFRITDGLAQKYGAERVIDTPVAESGIVGAAFGMAVAGLRPIAEMQFMGFSYPAYDQIVNHVSRIRNRSRHRFTAPLVIRIPYGAGIGAAEHHSESTEAVYAHIPGLKVVVASSPEDAKGLLLAAVDDPDPVVYLEPIRLYRAARGEVPASRYTTPIGEAVVDRKGSELTLVSYGAMMRETREAADRLAGEGVSAEVIDVRTLVPLDADTIVSSVEKTGRAVIVHEAPLNGGYGAEIVAQIQERALYSLRAPVQRVTGWDTVVPLRLAEHHYLPSVDRIVSAARRTLEG